MTTLVLQFIGPLQSYGTEKTYTKRRSNRYPTKSAVVGIISAAYGYNKNDIRSQRFNNLIMSVRIDQPGTILTDYHTTIAKDKYLTFREYLQDAKFTIFLESNDNQLILEISKKLREPVYAPVLGRRNCVPSQPVFNGIYNTIAKKLYITIPLLLSNTNNVKTTPFNIELKLENTNDGKYVQDKFNYKTQKYELRPESTVYINYKLFNG